METLLAAVQAGTESREVRRKGRQNSEIRRNFYLEGTVEEGNFVSRERLLFCARGGDIIIPFDALYLGLDWGRVSDETIATVGNSQNDVLDWFHNHAEFNQRSEVGDGIWAHQRQMT